MNLFVASLLASATMAHPGLRVNVTEEGQTLGSFYFTEEKIQLLPYLEQQKKHAKDEDFCDTNAVEDEDEKCDVITLQMEDLPKGDTNVVDFESLKRAFHFTTLTVHSNHKLPMPMTETFSETQVIAGDEKIDMPADIKKFFQYTVVKEKNDDAQKAAINDEDAMDRQHAGVAGKYGSLNIPNFGRDDEFLNEGSEYDPETVNNPRELIRLLKAANYLNYDVLVKYASAKIATLISLNNAYRIRALLGMPPNVGYTLESYTNAAEEKVKGLTEVKAEAPWFDMDNDKAKYTDVVAAYKPENIKYEAVEDVLREERAKDNKMIPDVSKITDDKDDY